MNKIRKILAPTDLSNLSKVGVRRALDIAGSEGAEVIVYNVITVAETPYPNADEALLASHVDDPKIVKTLEKRKNLLSGFVEKEFTDIVPKIKLRQEVEIGVPYKKIVEKAVDERVDMIVMCTHGRTGLVHMLIGSVTEKVVRLSPFPVLSVPPPEKATAVTGKALHS